MSSSDNIETPGAKTHPQSRSMPRAKYGRFDDGSFAATFFNDLAAAKHRVIIQSPYVTLRGVQRYSRALADCKRRDVRVCVFVQEPRNWQAEENASADDEVKRQQLSLALNLLASFDVHVNLKPRIHQKMAVIDENILWDGSLNILSHFDTRESMIRWVGRGEVLHALNRHNLIECATCSAAKAFSATCVPDEEYARWLRQLGLLIRTYRRAAAVSQRKLAANAETTQSLISQLEAGTRNISVDTLRNVCRCLELDIIVAPALEVAVLSRRLKEREQQHVTADTTFVKAEPPVVVDL